MMLDVFAHEYCLYNAVIIFTQGPRRSEVEALPSCERRNSDGGLRSTAAGTRTIERSRNEGIGLTIPS